MNTMDQEITKKSRLIFIKYASIIPPLLFIVSFLILFIFEKNMRIVKYEEMINSEKHILVLENAILDQEYRMVLEDLKFLQHTFSDVENSDEKIDAVAKIWREFSTHRNIYDQIRFLNCSGDEIIRINYVEGHGEIVPEHQLQNKSNRYYFKDTLNLSEESIYISQLDLNMENNMIEVPYKPVIRIGTSLYDANEQQKGVIILNYLADSMLTQFRSMGENSTGEIALLNSDGYWLSSENAELEYRFMFPGFEDQTFSKRYPDEWSRIKNGESELLTSNGLFLASKVVLNTRVTMHTGDTDDENRIQMRTGNWYIVSSVLRNDDTQIYFPDDNQGLMWAVLTKNSIYFFLILTIALLIAYLISLNRKAFLTIKFYSEYDALTMTFNRRAGLEKLKEIVPYGERRKFNISLCFLDVNGLKTVNDSLGHKYGDELILSAVQGIKGQIRKKDLIIRFGGDEFLVVFYNSNLEESEMIWQRIVKVYEEINQVEKRSYNISVSHGIVEVTNESAEGLEALIKLADEKMYAEKRIIKENIQTLK